MERGEDSTTARGFGAGTAIYVSFDRKTLDEFVDGKIAASSPGGGGGLTQAQVDARVVDGTKAYARAGNTSKVPRSDLQRLSDVTAQGSSDLQDGDRIAVEDASDSVTKRASIGALGDKIADDQVEDWARDSNTDPIPGPKLSNAPQPASGRLVPAGGSAGEVLKRTATGTEWAEDAGGLSQSEVDARVAERVPDGGSTGQVLAKKSNADGDTEWKTDATSTSGSGLDQAAVDGRINDLRPNAFTTAEKAKLGDLPDQVSGNAEKIIAFDSSGDYTTVEGDFLRQVQTGDTITGDGTSTGALDVANPFTADDESKLDAIPDQGSGNANKVVGFDASGNYEARDATSGGLNQAAVDGRITALRPNAFTDADERKLDELSDGGITEDEGTFTAVTRVRDIEAQRTPGQTPQGGFTGDSNLLRIHLDGDSGNITAVLTGGASEYRDSYLRLGDRHLKFSQASLSSVIGSTIEYSWQSGDYSGWIKSGSAEAWAVVRPIEDKDLVPDQAGHEGEVLHTDGTTSRWDTAARPTAISKLPVPLVPRRRYVLTAQDSIDQSIRIVALQEQTTLRGIEFPSHAIVNGIRAFIPTFSGNNAAALRGKVFLSLHSVPSSAVTKIHLGTALGGQAEYTVAAASVPGETRLYEVSGLAYADIEPGTGYWVNVEFADGSFVYAPTVVQPGDWTAITAQSVTHTPGSSATWAEFGSPEPLPTNKLPYQVSTWARTGNPDRIPPNKAPTPGISTVFDETPGPGFTVNGSSSTVDSSVTAPTPAFDLDTLDTPGQGNGYFVFECRFTLTNPLSNTIAFQAVANRDEAEDSRTANVSDDVSASTLKALTAYGPSSLVGHEIGRVSVYKAADELGIAIAYVSRDSNNQIGVWMKYEGSAGSENFTLSTTLTAFYQAHDSAPDITRSYSESVITPALRKRLSQPTAWWKWA